MNPMMAMFGQMMKGGMNPQAMVQKMMNNSEIMSNPMARNVLDMAQKGDVAGIEEFGRNIAKERGVNFDNAFSEFKGSVWYEVGGPYDGHFDIDSARKPCFMRFSYRTETLAD